MNSLLLLITAAALGIEVGWEPLPEGGHEYTIQIEPQLLDVLAIVEDEIFSDVPQELDVRRYRLMVGTGKLARVFAPPDKSPEDAIAARQAHVVQPSEPQLPPPPGTPHEAQPLPASGSHSTPEDPLLDDQAARAGHERPGLPDLGPTEATAKKASEEPPALSVEANKLSSDSAAAEPAKPWLAFVAVMAFLCCSLGANLYLGWAAWDARSRYREVLARFRPAVP
jgi:hypothetical protein